MQPRRFVTLAAAALLATAAAPLASVARAGESERRVQEGDTVDDVELRTLDGKRDRLLSRSAKANVFVFFRPQQERSLDTLKELAACEKEFGAKPVRFVGVVSDSWPLEEVRAFVQEAGVRMPILLDEGDALYGKLGVRLHPVILVVDAKRKLVAYEPFRQINYCERVKVRIRFALGEVGEAEIAKVDEPPRSTTRTEEGVARRHLNFARNLQRIGQQEKALEEVQKSLAILPSADAYAMQGELLAAMGRCPEALPAFDAALKMEPDHAVAREGKRTCGR